MAENEFVRGDAEDPMDSQLPFGAAADLNEFGVAFSPDAMEEETDFTMLEDAEPLEGDMAQLTDELFGETARPTEPLTQGVPFGEGADMLPTQQSPDDLMRQVASELLESPAASSRVKNFAVRVLTEN